MSPEDGHKVMAALQEPRVGKACRLTRRCGLTTPSLLLGLVLALQAFPAQCLAAEGLRVKVIQTSRSGDRLREYAPQGAPSTNGSKFPSIRLRPDERFQEIIGFGGAFTESAAFVLSQLDKGKRDEVIQAYFSPAGAHYSLTRTHINSCDFSLANYAYATVPGDTNLEHFSIQEDLDDLIPLIQDAMTVPGAGFKIIASPWTAPPWMKDNAAWNGGSLQPRYSSTWALYISKYIRPGAFRIGVDSEANDLMVTACRNADGLLAVVVLNETRQEAEYQLVLGSQHVQLNIPAQALQTVLWETSS